MGDGCFQVTLQVVFLELLSVGLEAWCLTFLRNRRIIKEERVLLPSLCVRVLREVLGGHNMVVLGRAIKSDCNSNWMINLVSSRYLITLMIFTSFKTFRVKYFIWSGGLLFLLCYACIVCYIFSLCTYVKWKKKKFMIWLGKWILMNLWPTHVSTRKW